MSSDEQIDIEDLLGNIKVPINYSNEQNLQQSSMFHFSMKVKDTISVMKFQSYHVNKFLNTLIGYIVSQPLNVHTEPTVILSGYPFLNSRFKRCEVITKSEVHSESGNQYLYRFKGIIFQDGLVKLHHLCKPGMVMTF